MTKLTTKTSDLILNSARNLFWENGFKKISVEDICIHASVSKMTFYRNFSNKLELAIRVVDEMIKIDEARFQLIMSSEANFRQKMERVVQHRLDSTRNLNLAFMTDIESFKDGVLAQKIHAFQQKRLKVLMSHLEIAQKQGNLRQGINLEFVIIFFEMIQTQMMDADVLALFKSPQVAIVELLNFFLYGIVNEEKG